MNTSQKCRVSTATVFPYPSAYTSCKYPIRIQQTSHDNFATHPWLQVPPTHTTTRISNLHCDILYLVPQLIKVTFWLPLARISICDFLFGFYLLHRAFQVIPEKTEQHQIYYSLWFAHTVYHQCITCLKGTSIPWIKGFSVTQPVLFDLVQHNQLANIKGLQSMMNNGWTMHQLQLL